MDGYSEVESIEEFVKRQDNAELIELSNRVREEVRRRRQDEVDAVEWEALVSHEENTYKRS